ncbi:hypothetical protein EKO27_g2696 [Xylaria grammica]|uniref:Translin-associated protein X n=1 Tax=Xylaria grammica TaxID=363999 RepID=A0A439DDD8_9PEZI|nr:hypothetical protein EKO27_g2696 [Xylaria grammica]
MSEVIVPKKKDSAMGAGVKRDYQGKEKAKRDAGAAAPDHPRNAYTSMFESFRDELDEHHDRRMRIGKVSRDVTALSKKIVRKLSQPIPERIQSEIDGRVKEIAELLETIQADVQGANRYRYPLICLEEFVEAVSFAHYLRHQTLMTPGEAQEALPADIRLTAPRLRLRHLRPHGRDDADDGGDDAKRTILADMQSVSSMLQISPTLGGKTNVFAKKLDIMIEQVRKVERLGYGVAVRGNERPKGWMPDLNEGFGGSDDIAMAD